MFPDPVTIENFRNELNEAALERGWIYFGNGWVKAPREILPHYFEAMVEEVNPHAVSYMLRDDGIFTDFFCTCGDHAARGCRHMAAVLFYLEHQWQKDTVKTFGDLEQKRLFLHRKKGR